MNIPLKKELQDWIDGEVRSGRYGSEAEVVEDALRQKMRAEEAAYFREKLRKSEEDIREGRVIPADDAFFDDLRARVRQIANQTGE